MAIYRYGCWPILSSRLTFRCLTVNETVSFSKDASRLCDLPNPLWCRTGVVRERAHRDDGVRVLGQVRVDRHAPAAPPAMDRGDPARPAGARGRPDAPDDLPVCARRLPRAVSVALHLAPGRRQIGGRSVRDRMEIGRRSVTDRRQINERPTRDRPEIGGQSRDFLP